MINAKLSLHGASVLALALAGVLAAAPAKAADAVTPAADASANQVDQVVVQARKVSEDVQQVPIPVTVLSGQMLERQNLNNFSDFQCTSSRPFRSI